MQVVNIDNVVSTFSVNIFAELLDINLGGCAFHHNTDDVFDNRDSCEKDNETEEVCAKGVCHPHRWEEINNESSDDDADTHEHVAEDVQVGCINVDVGLLGVVVVMVMAMAVIVMMVLSLVALLIGD